MRKEQEPMQLLVLGNTELPVVQATQQAIRAAGLSEVLRTECRGVPSGVPAQPLGMDELIRGAQNRASRALQEDAAATYGMGVERGLIQLLANSYIELSFVALQERKGPGPFELPNEYFLRATTAGVPVPLRYVDLSLATGRKKPARAFLAEATGAEAEDWCGFLMDGRLPQQAILEQAIRAVLLLDKHDARWAGR